MRGRIDAETGASWVLRLDAVQVGEEGRPLVLHQLAAPHTADNRPGAHCLALDLDDLPVLVADHDPAARSDKVEFLHQRG